MCFPSHPHTSPQEQDPLSRLALTAAIGFGFVVESPVAVALVGTVGMCSLAHQIAVGLADLHVVSDVWMYSDPKAMHRLFSV